MFRWFCFVLSGPVARHGVCGRIPHSSDQPGYPVAIAETERWGGARTSVRPARGDVSAPPRQGGTHINSPGISEGRHAVSITLIRRTDRFSPETAPLPVWGNLGCPLNFLLPREGHITHNRYRSETSKWIKKGVAPRYAKGDSRGLAKQKRRPHFVFRFTMRYKTTRDSRGRITHMRG